MKWAHLVQWECLGRKGRQVTPEAQEFLLQGFLEKKAPQAPQVRSSMLCPSLSITNQNLPNVTRLTSEYVPPQEDLAHLVLQVPQEESLRATFFARVHLEIKGLLAPMVQEV